MGLVSGGVSTERARAERALEILAQGMDPDVLDSGYGYEHMVDMARDLEPLARDVLSLVDRLEELERRNFNLRAYADYEYVADADLQARATAAESRVERLEEFLRAAQEFGDVLPDFPMGKLTETQKDQVQAFFAALSAVLLHPEEEGK